jgi:hypothetical protein
MHNYSKNYVPKKLFSYGIVGMIAGVDDWIEGIKIDLKENLKSGKTYLMKIKVALGTNTFQKVNSTYKIAIHFSKWNTNWFAKPNNTQNVLWENALNFQFQGSNLYKENEFISLEHYFSVPHSVDGGTSNDLKTLIIRTNPENYNNFGYSYSYIDDVELYEISDLMCNSNWIIENKTYEYNELPIEASNTITAGKNVIDNNLNGPVICDSKQEKPFGDSKVVYKAGSKIVLKNGFIVKKEAYFHAYIAPCKKECNDPLTKIDKHEINICSTEKYCSNLGSKPVYNMNYEWTSDNPSLLKCLNYTNISNPEICIPTTIPNGLYTIKLKVTNKCGEFIEETITIYINRSPFNCTPYIVHQGGRGGWGGYYFNGKKRHDKFTATYKVFCCDEIRMDVINENNEIIDSKTFNVDTYFRRIKNSTADPNFYVEYYKDVPCGDYIFRFTLINKCTNQTKIYDEKARYYCEYN